MQEWVYTLRTAQEGSPKIKPIYMNTNIIIKISLSILSLAVVAFAATTQHTADYLPALTTGVSYLAVAVLIGIAAVDYRTNSRKCVTGL